MASETQSGMPGFLPPDQEYQPRHAANQLDDGLLEVLATAADEYRYKQMYLQYDAEYAIERGRLFSDGSGENQEFFAAKYQIIAKSLGRQASAKAYADELRAQIYYVPPDGVWYEGRHRKTEITEVEAGPEPVFVPPPARSVIGRHPPIVYPPQVPALPPEPEPEQPPQSPAQKSRRNPFKLFQTLGAAVGVWLSHPEKGNRRWALVTLGSFAVGGVVGWLLNQATFDNTQYPPEAMPSPSNMPPPQDGFTQPYFDNLQPQNYEGQSYEWGAAADDYGAPNATPQILGMINDARAQGAQVDTWGDPNSGRWGISSVTVGFEDGSQKAYYDTRHKWAILQHLSKLRHSAEDSEDDFSS